MKCFGWVKRILTIENNYEGGMKLEPWIFKRMDQDLEEKLFFDLQMTTRNSTKITEILRENEKRRGWANNDLKSILEKHLTDEIHSYVKLWKEFGITPGELEESGKILGKDLWVRAH